MITKSKWVPYLLGIYTNTNMYRAGRKTKEWCLRRIEIKHFLFLTKQSIESVTE